ncbi:AMP-binding protein [Roseibium sp.]|uniref:AMP-binding protein n=1 Tax=Roseibium sp. TaxID=1936156 RepID=UPI003A98005A
MAFVGDSLDALAKLDADAAALSCGKRAWTRSGLTGEINSLSATLRTRVPFGARVALCLRDPASLLIAFFAVARRGAIALVYDPDWPQMRRDAIDRQVAPDIVLDDLALSGLCAEGGAARLLAGVEDRVPEAADPFYAGFTSGSTGEPKAYLRSHGSWLESFLVSQREFPIGPADTVIIPGNLVHSLHLYGAVHGLVVGAGVVLAERFNPKNLARHIAGSGSAVLYATPTQMRLMAAEILKCSPAENVRLVLASGAKWREDDRKAMSVPFPAARLVEFYGASEMSFITVSTPEDDAPDGSVGRAALGVSICIRDEQGRTCAPGDTGVIWVSSAMLFSGYVCGGGSEVVREGAWLTVGDCGYLDEDGFLFLSGRQKRMIVTSGINIFPEEVEAALLEHPQVRAAAVLPLADPLRGKVMVAVMQTDVDADLSDRDLRRHCAVRLGRGRTPRRYIMVTTLPLTPGGKIDLQTLQQRLDTGELS